MRCEPEYVTTEQHPDRDPGSDDWFDWYNMNGICHNDNPELGYLCQQCPYCTTSSKALQYHVTNKHRHVPQKNETTSRYHCPQCDQIYRHRSALIRHIKRTHEKEENKFQCDICGFHLYDKSSLHNHKKKVHLKISVSCELCDKTFVYRERLKIHMDRDHRQIIPVFQCEVDGCQKTYKKSPTLKWHQNSAHLENKKTFQCDQCDKSYTNFFSYRIYFHQHKTEGHACTVCGKVIAIKRYMNIHMRVHTGEKPFSCTHCDKSFISKRALQIHQAVHHQGEAI